ncbi:hypothetical protein [Candidatus Poriferisocius sp.]
MPVQLYREFSRAEWRRLRQKHGFWKSLAIQSGRVVELAAECMPISIFK